MTVTPVGRCMGQALSARLIENFVGLSLLREQETCRAALGWTAEGGCPYVFLGAWGHSSPDARIPLGYDQ